MHCRVWAAPALTIGKMALPRQLYVNIWPGHLCLVYGVTADCTSWTLIPYQLRLFQSFIRKLFFSTELLMVLYCLLFLYVTFTLWFRLVGNVTFLMSHNLVEARHCHCFVAFLERTTSIPVSYPHQHQICAVCLEHADSKLAVQQVNHLLGAACFGGECGFCAASRLMASFVHWIFTHLIPYNVDTGSPSPIWLRFTWTTSSGHITDQDPVPCL